MLRAGTDGWRGVISRDIGFDTFRLIARGYALYLKRMGLSERGVAVGFDRRFLSPQYAREVCEVLSSEGIPVLLGKRYLPTPALSLYVKAKGLSGGIMITASHNPPEYNGLKIKEGFGGPALPETVRKIEAIIGELMEEDLPEDKPSVHYRNAESFDPHDFYIDEILHLVDTGLMKKFRMDVLVDPMHGCGASYFRDLLQGLGWKVREIRGEENPCFGGMAPEPVERNLSELRKRVAKGGFHLGIAFDGDGDRVAAVDSSGTFITPHYIQALLLRHLVEHRKLKGFVVKTFSTTVMMEMMGRMYGLEVIETPIGFKYISDLMLREDVLIGGEESGGIGIKGYIPERDGLFSAMLLLEALCYMGKGLGEAIKEIKEEVGEFFYERWDIPFYPHEPDEIMERVKRDERQELAGKRVKERKIFDGIKYILEDDSWLLLRISGTEPVLRIYAETRQKALAPLLLSEGRQIAGL
uniref:Phosphoglucomutase n=1 Tax=uncultured prokaryote TaxID=198431 RepID=H5SPA7_9ZZZZ|nr:phosphoglucomutase [uncultured prokaryote]